MAPLQMPEARAQRRLYHELFQYGRYVRLFTIGDGSCFFHAVAAALNMGGDRDKSTEEQRWIGHALRARIAATYPAFLESLDQTFRDATDTHGRRIFPTTDAVRDPGTDAGEVLWRLTARELGLTVVVCEAPGRSYVTPDEAHRRPDRTLLIAWVNRNHFEPILATAAASNAGPPMSTDPPPADGLRGVYSKRAPVVRSFVAD